MNPAKSPYGSSPKRYRPETWVTDKVLVVELLETSDILFVAGGKGKQSDGQDLSDESMARLS